MRTGTVQSVDLKTGKGVVVSDLGELAFFYSSALAGIGLKFDVDLVGQRVRFDPQRTDRGLRARNMRPA